MASSGVDVGNVVVLMNSSSALKFFISALPSLIPNPHTCWDVLTHLLPPETSSPAAVSNPLFDEDPVNDYAEELILVEYLVKSLKGVMAALTNTAELSERHFKVLSRHLLSQAQAFEEQEVTSIWEFSRSYRHALLGSRMAILISPLLIAISQRVGACDISHLEERITILELQSFST